MTEPTLFASNISALDPPRQAGAYRVLYVDPPWPEFGGGRIKRGADRHYALMSVDEIVALPFSAWAAADAHCYCWVTNNYLQAGFAALSAWGFRHVTTITWIKDRPGLGQYFRGRTEHCLFGVRGCLPYRALPDGRRAQGETVLYELANDSPVIAPAADANLPLDLPTAFEAGRTAHSVKPETMRCLIERVSAGPCLECFARRAAPGWDAWGAESRER